MQTQRGFVSAAVLIAIVLGLIVVGGGAYYVVQQNTQPQTPQNYPDISSTQQLQTQSQTTSIPVVKPPTNTSAQIQNSTTEFSRGILFSVPIYNGSVALSKNVPVSWNLPRDMLDAIPSDFNSYIMLYVIKQGDPERVNFASIGDGYDAKSFYTLWDTQQFRQAHPDSGVYKIVAKLRVSPKDASRLCARSVNKDCYPSEADSTVMQRMARITEQTGWFTIATKEYSYEIVEQTSLPTTADIEATINSVVATSPKVKISGTVSGGMSQLLGMTLFTDKPEYKGYYSGNVTIAGNMWYATLEADLLPGVYSISLNVLDAHSNYGSANKLTTAKLIVK